MTKDEAHKLITDLLASMDIPYDSIDDLSNETELKFNVRTKRSGLLIGSHGDSISALNHIVKKIAAKADENARITVDVNGYLEQMNQGLRNKVFIMAERARSFKVDVELEPMTAYERMVVHSFLSNDPHLSTESVGQGKNRRVVIKYKNE